jgi:AraC-like DNA-binding protein
MRVEALGLRPATLACLHTASIVNVTQLTSHSCIELMQHPDIGTAGVYEIVRRLHMRGLALPNEWGTVRLPNERSLEMFRLRFVEGLSLIDTGRQFGVSRSRVYQLLHAHFGVSTLPTAAKTTARHRRGAGSWE